MNATVHWEDKLARLFQAHFTQWFVPAGPIHMEAAWALGPEILKGDPD